jgi:glucose-1-phosphate cytidylyltransferase
MLDFKMGEEDMITVILAGGKGSRILEETREKPKAMVKIGEYMIVEHIMRSFFAQGYQDFLILGGYKFQVLLDYYKKSALCIEYNEEKKDYLFSYRNMRIRLLDTGENKGSAGRLLSASEYLKTGTFLLTYCDAVSSVNLRKLVHFHDEHNSLVTLTAVRPKPRFGVLEIDSDGQVISMREKNKIDSPIINGGFMVVEPGLLDLITSEKMQLEKDVLSPLAGTDRLWAYYHDGFWQCMDTIQERDYLCSLYQESSCPWLCEY